MNKTGILKKLALPLALAVTLGLWGVASAEEPVVIGWQIDYERLTTIGPQLGAGANDFIKVFNKNRGGMVDGVPVKFSECDHGYDVNRGLECYQRQKMEGIVSLQTFGTPHTYSLSPKLHADKIPAISPGFGRADAADGKRFPYLFPAAATYWSQATAAIKYIEDAEGSIKGKKIAYLFFDNPAGREPIRILEMLQEKLGFKLRTFAVPSPGVEMGAQVTDITRRFKADWVVAHMFGRAPSVSFKELVRKGFPLDHYIGLVWNTNESDIAAAGADTAKGVLSIQFTGLGHDFPIHKEIKALYEAEGKPMHDYWNITGYYNRGIFSCALQLEAVTNAIRMSNGKRPITGEMVQKGYEAIKDFTLDGFLPPMEITPEDHEGGGWVRVYQWDGTKFILAKDWYKAHRDIIKARLAEVAAEGDKK